MTALKWSLSALDDLDRIDDYTAELSERWALRVHRRIVSRCTSLTTAPSQGRPKRNGWRSLSIPDIQYVIWYEVGDDVVTIHRVWHTRQNREAP